MSTDFPTAPLTSRFINQRAAAPWKSLSLRLTHRNPGTPFGNAVKGFTRSREFAEAFCTWVLPDQPQQQAFEAFAGELENMGCAKWPILTPYRFLLHPNVDVLIKPENLKHASELARLDINYRPELNWLTYTKVMEFYRHISVQIADLNPRDMIDVQNFIWCIDSDQYRD